MGRRQRGSSAAARRQPFQRLGGREDLLLEEPARTRISYCPAHRSPAELLHLADDANAGESRRVAFAGRWISARVAVAVARSATSDAAHQLYREASLRRGMERDRDVARRGGIRGRRTLRNVAAGALRPVRLVRLWLFQRLGPRERDASADDSRVRDERQSAPADTRRAAAAVLTHQARLQADEVSRVADI